MGYKKGILESTSISVPLNTIVQHMVVTLQLSKRESNVNSFQYMQVV